jgi:hypothetical protein
MGRGCNNPIVSTFLVSIFLVDRALPNKLSHVLLPFFTIKKTSHLFTIITAPECPLINES